MLRGFFTGYPTLMTIYETSDAATQQTPVPHVANADDTFLTNDGLGTPISALDSSGLGNIWNTSEQNFNFSKLSVGDIVIMQVHTKFTGSVIPFDVEHVMDFAIGSSNPYSVLLDSRECSIIGEHSCSFSAIIYIRNKDTIDYPAKLRFKASQDSSVVVDGWSIYTVANRSLE